MPDLYRLHVEQLDRARRLRRDLGARSDRLDRGLEGSSPSSASSSGSTSRTSAASRAQRSPLHFGSIERLAAATPEEIQEVEGIGPIVAEAVAEWFADEENTLLVAELGELGLRLELGEEERPAEGPLSGQQLRHNRHARALQP